MTLPAAFQRVIPTGNGIGLTRIKAARPALPQFRRLYSEVTPCKLMKP